MRRIFALSLLLAVLFTFAACDSGPTYLPPVTPGVATDPSTTPTLSDPSSDTEPTEPVAPAPQPITLADARNITQDLITRYWRYCGTGVCCDYEWSDTDLSEYVSDPDNYFYQQYRILCCETVEEWRAHVLRVLDPSLTYSEWESMLFTDPDGNLYMQIIPMGINGYENLTVVQFSSETIIATLDVVDVDEALYSLQFTITNNGDCFVITAVEVMRDENDPYYASFTVTDMPVNGDVYPQCCHIPMLQSPMTEVGDINRILHNTIMPEFGELVRANYTYVRKGTLLSIFAFVQLADDDMAYPHALNVDLKTLNLLTAEETLAQLGVAPETFYQNVQTALETYLSGSTSPEMAEYNEMTLSRENITASQPILSEDGTIDATVTVFVPAGGGATYFRLDLDTGTYVRLPECEIHS